MLHSISWQQYFLFLFIALIIYYLFVWIVYYKARIPSFAALQKKNTLPEDQPDEVMSTSQHVIDEIRGAFGRKHTKNELIYSLQSRLQKYNQWDEPGFRDTINAFILGESERKCSIHLSEEDLRVLWL